MFKIKVWNNDTMIFEGYSKKVPKTDEEFKAWTLTKDGNATKQRVFSPAQYRITYEEVDGNKNT
jgi:hypothetical protein